MLVPILVIILVVLALVALSPRTSGALYGDPTIPPPRK